MIGRNSRYRSADILVGVFSGCPCMACLRRSGRGWQTNRPLNRNPKPENRKGPAARPSFGFLISDFLRISGFELRI